MSVHFTGQATTAIYQQALSSITYLNTANEPTRDPPRRVEFQVFDGMFFSNLVTGFVNISLVDDNRLMLTCGDGSMPTFTEGSSDPLSVASELTISDIDANSMISSAMIVLDNAQAGDEIRVNPSAAGGLTLDQSSGVSISINRPGVATQYQVRCSIPFFALSFLQPKFAIIGICGCDHENVLCIYT